MRALAIVVLVLAMVGCRAGAGPMVVEFTKTGGIASLDDRLEVRESGAMLLTQRRGGTKAGMATAEEISRLRGLVDSAEFQALPGEFRGKGFDVITYTIRAETARGRKVVRTVDGAEQPRVLADVLYELERLAGKCVEGTR